MKKCLNSAPESNRNEEKEIKVQISKEQYDKLLNNRPLSSKPINPVNQKDIYYDREDMYITNLNRGLRVRFNGDTPICLEFKSLFYNSYANSNNPWFIEEITFPFPFKQDSLENFFSLLVRLNLLPPITTTYYSTKLSQLPEVEQVLLTSLLKPMITVKKHRLGYQKNDVQYIFDYIEGLGYFLEIESQDEDPLKLLDSLGLDNYQFIRNGYNDMLAVNIPSYLPNEEKQKRFKEDPSWNILPNEKEIVEAMLAHYR